MKYFKYIALFIVIILNSPFKLKSDNLPLRQISVNEGLSSATVYSILQDKRNFIWIATDLGVCKFDGNSFYYFNVNNGLPENEIIFLYSDSYQKLWFITLSGKLGLIHNEKIVSVSSLEKYKFSGIFEDSKKRLWLGTLQNGIILIDKNDTIYYKNDTLKNTGLITPHFEDSSGAVWFTNHKEFIIISDNRISRTFFSKDEINYCRVLKTKSGRILYSIGDKIYQSDFPEQNCIYTNNAGLLKQNDISWMLDDSKQRFWIATISNGVLLYEKQDFFSEKVVRFLKGSNVSRIIEDNDGNLWFSTLNDGVFFLPNGAPYYSHFNSDHGLSDLRINVIALDNDKEVLAGCNDGNAFTLNDSIFKKKNFINDSSIRKITSMLNIPNGDIVIGTNKGLYVYKKDNTTLEIFQNSVKSLKLDSNKKIWMQGAYRIIRFDEDYQIEKEFFTDRIYSFVINKNNQLIFSTSDGVYYIENDKINNEIALSKYPVMKLEVTEDSTLWALTNNKLFSYKDGIIREQKINNEYPTYLFKSIFAGINGELFISTNKGLIVFNPLILNNYYQVINQSSGLPTNDVNSVISTDDKIYIATNLGLTIIQKNKTIAIPKQPDVHLTRFQIWDKDTSVLRTYELKYNQNNIKIHFIALDYKSEKEILYKYKLTGMDTSWNYSYNTYAYYSYIPPGEYTFSVKAMNINGIWSEQTASMSLTILPPYWQKWWFRLLIFIISILIILLVIRNRMKKAELKQKLAESELKALRAQMNPHFIFNVISSIQNFILSNEPKVAYAHLEKFAKLMRSILDNSKEKNISLADEIKEMENYLELEKLRTNNKFDYEINVESSINTEECSVPSMIIQPFLENSIKHGITPNIDKGRLEVRFFKDKNNIICVIKDNGIGRKKSQEMHSKTIATHRSAGLKITEERLHLINSGVKNKKIISFTDLYDNNHNALGTQVEIKIPQV